MTSTKRKDSKNRVLKEGESQRENGTYCYRWRDANGTRRAIYAPTLTELREKEDALKRDILDGIKPKAINRTTLNDAYERWIVLKRPPLKPNTFSVYTYMYERYVMENFGNRRVAEIKKSDIRAFYASLVRNRGISVSTIDSIHTDLIQIFGMLCEDGQIRMNPATGAYGEFKKSYHFETQKRKALTADEQAALEHYLETEPKAAPWAPVILFALYTGLRIGEIGGLRWCDVDLEKNTIDVNHTLVYFQERLEPSMKHQPDGKRCVFRINTPKTKAGRRVVPMNSRAKEALIKQKAYIAESGLVCDCEVDGYTDFIFLNRFGQPYYYSTVNAAIYRITRDYNLSEMERHDKHGTGEPLLLPAFSCHTLRHTFATRCVELGVNVKALQEILGHKDASTTLTIYSDASPEFKQAEIDKLTDS